MFALTHQHRFYLYSEACDMRKGINGLSGLVRNEMEGNPLSGDVYVFINRSRNLMKLLIFEGDGYLLYSKRLSAGRFQNRRLTTAVTQATDRATAQAEAWDTELLISYQELQFMIRGIDLYSIKRRKRFSLKALENKLEKTA